MRAKKSYAVSATDEMINWSKNTLPTYQLTFSSFVERCYLMFEKNKDFRYLLLHNFYEDTENERETKNNL